MTLSAIEFEQNQLTLLDQRTLPHNTSYITCRTSRDVAEAILNMTVRGAPAIAVSAAYGVVLSAKAALSNGGDIHTAVTVAVSELMQTRPTAVNLRYAMRRMQQCLDVHANESPNLIVDALLQEAHAMAREDMATNQAIGTHGQAAFQSVLESVHILTHCNTGSLATVSYGTALGVIRALHANGRLAQVFVDETRPYLQGARLTAFELEAEGIPYTLIADNMAAWLMATKRVDGVVVGADRIAANGDTANKIGTYGLAVLAAAHHVPFYVAAPLSTFDLEAKSGQDIPIEERSADEVREVFGQKIAPANAPVWNPAFDITPAHLITGIVTEVGMIDSPNTETVARHLNAQQA
ncbi:MAG: S-methyl-5-thioribose-1-phosphate isomerase [Alicyclobacillaceae bacterium]|jgi:methylthioribose-1-phosphate isomerase|uniref:S-methyl-5-thioribose-1-phosphate isomerase n=1 Tax=Alicyclobacillus sp. SP_1 TaxID=2942475 RepID=UPI0021570A56|nr:S-methyl-5-thioribose-1-phosphate isomerase [Alicyclobacillus sp. SP_1]MCY0888202.1 S-methyl-5-thioribose-1-phosphate isomerase [Alicyclobacillaceae bacterium]